MKHRLMMLAVWVVFPLACWWLIIKTVTHFAGG
jgi:hypothetical protein